MNIYKLSKEEIEKFHNEFNKTDFGKRAKLFSIMPIFLAYVGFATALIIIVADIASDLVSAEGIFSSAELIVFSIMGVSAILLSVGCVTQLQYGKMLNDYIASKKR